MYHIASRVTPQMIAKCISVINLYALGAEPSIVANNVDVMPIVAVRAPPLMGAVLLRRINAAAILFAAPTIVALTNWVAL